MTVLKNNTKNHESGECADVKEGIKESNITSFVSQTMRARNLMDYHWRIIETVIQRKKMQALRAEKTLPRTIDFNSSLPKIVNDALSNSEFAKIPNLENRLKKLTEYHTVEREPVQGQMTLFAYEILERPENINDHTLYQASVAAWAIELIQSYFLIMDDVEDGAVTRHSKPCWHLLPEVNTLAMNDASMFRSLIHEIVQKNFTDPLYTKLVNLFNENDFMDCFDEELETGKTGSDITEGKCTWLAVKSLERCNAAQRNTFTSCYGSSEPEKVNRIKELYKNLALIQLYKEDQRSRYEIFMRKVRELPSDAMHLQDLFYKLLQVIQSKH
ncbi:farnesyl pyrophosphate synthase-like isoform X2 [Battus philenor]|uniref:farnesyl pyrophosphate synthase-like isoform X2 n=1 Tax=Battus philenor TaxID=42288 RepID=UPI0035D09709